MKFVAFILCFLISTNVWAQDFVDRMDAVEDNLQTQQDTINDLNDRINVLEEDLALKQAMYNELKQQLAGYFGFRIPQVSENVENTSLTIGGISVGMLFMKYGWPLLLQLGKSRIKEKLEDLETDKEE